MIRLLVVLLLACQATAKAVFAHFMLENTKFFTVETWKTEIRKAQESKIDAFALNFNYGADYNNARLSLAFQAANALGFSLFFSFDYAGLEPWSKEAVIALLIEYGPNGAYFKRPDGKPLASTFEGWERAEDWPEIKTRTNAFFIPDWSSRGAKVAMTLPGPDGLFSWAAWPEAPNNMSIEVDSSYTYFLKGKPYMMPVSPWFYTNLPGYCKNWLWPSDSLWWERWQQIWWKQPEYVQIISWNDYGESHYIGGLYTNELHAFQPETGRPPFDYVSGMAHDGWRELLPFAIETYKNNISTVTEERLVAWWRPNPNTQCPNAGTTANTFSQGQEQFDPVNSQPNAIYWSMVAKSQPDIRVTVGGVSVPSVVIGEPVGGVGIWHGRAMYNSARGNVIVTAYRNNVIIPGLLMQGDKPISSSCSSMNWNAVVKSQRAPAGAAVTPPYRLDQQHCIAGKGEGDLDGICKASCAKGYCPPEVCTCTKKSGVAVTVKWTVPTVYGCPQPQYTASYLGLCSFLCGTGSCLQQYCIPSSTEKQCSVSADPAPPRPPPGQASTCTPVGSSCNQGTGEGNLQGLCVFSCERGFCPEKACKCTRRGKSLDAPVLSKVVGCPIDSMPTDSWKEYIDLCQFTCERNYCPPGACKNWRNGTTDGVSTINCKPANVPGPAFNTRSFQEMDARVKAHGGFEDHVLAAVVHMPMWVFARAEDGRRPCYPESAIVLDGYPACLNTLTCKPNPGTSVPNDNNPSNDCRIPLDENNTPPYSISNPFPVYVGAKFCDGKWRLNFNVYYVHDGVLSIQGHRHDWDSGMTLVFAEVESTGWFRLEGGFIAKHSQNNYFSWEQLHTVNNYEDRAEQRSGLNRLHPKVYVGFISHAGHPTPNYDVWNQDNANVGVDRWNQEYRNGDYVYMPQASDHWNIHSWTEISRDWKYEDKTPPWKVMDNMCKLTEETIGCGANGCFSRTKKEYEDCDPTADPNC